MNCLLSMFMSPATLSGGGNDSVAATLEKSQANQYQLI